MTLLLVEGLTKEFPGGVRANVEVDLEVEAGEVFGLLGHNGAGKTTLLRQIIGLAKPTEGSITLDGTDCVADPMFARRASSLQLQAGAPLDGLTPRQAISLTGRIRGLRRREAKERTNALIDGLDLAPWADARSDRLSGGVARLTAFCMAAVEPGRLLLLDEPTNDVDPVRRRLLWGQIRSLTDLGATILLVTHNVIEAEQAVDRLAILDNGRVIARGSPNAIRGDQNGLLRLTLTASDKTTSEWLAENLPRSDLALPESTITVAGLRVSATVPAERAVAALEWAQAQQAVQAIDDVSLAPVSLEDAYIRLVGAEGEEQG